MTADRHDLSCEEVDELAGLYVLGALEAAEEDAVQQHLATCANPHPQLAEMGGVVSSLAGTIEPIEPPEELRGRVLAAVAATAQVGATAAVGATATPSVTATATAQVGVAAPPDATTRRVSAPVPVMQAIPKSAAEPISLAAARDRRAARLGGVWQTLLAVAAVLLIVVLGATTVVFQRQASDAEARADTLGAAIAASLDPTSSVATLRGSGSAAAAAGFAAFPGTGTGYVVIHGLPNAPAGQTYEAWFLAGSTAIPSVLMTPGSDGLIIVQGLTAAKGADAMAVTVEPAAGSQAPTSTPIIVGTMQQGTIASAFR